MAITIDKLHDLIVLAKALSLGKFACREYEARELAASPYSGDLLLRITKAMEEYIPNYQAAFGSIEQNPTYLEVLKVHVSHLDNWISLDGPTKTQVVKDLASPYMISQSTIDAIVSGSC
ncbi:hypothetical protein [Spirosoma linguale]|uniref:Uncharacterized protein n=1 Tax=Spirosoma linguale (strain ATCC 33905 / DSM 74 / LMG 10896 / Claus 1) TaxID=504472 RepID=D2QVT8_SPILD|nr:hypothetical protein Slin_6976 [Spirosoma linguale DSM 74]